MCPFFSLSLFLEIASGGMKDENAGRITYVEGKGNIVIEKHIHQLVATTVACSFTHNNISKGKKSGLNPLTPTLLMNHKTFHVCMYDCVNDVLLLSKPCKLFESDKTGTLLLAPSACLFLWMVVNHRYVFCAVLRAISLVLAIALQVGGASSYH